MHLRGFDAPYPASPMDPVSGRPDRPTVEFLDHRDSTDHHVSDHSLQLRRDARTVGGGGGALEARSTLVFAPIPVPGRMPHEGAPDPSPEVSTPMSTDPFRHEKAAAPPSPSTQSSRPRAPPPSGTPWRPSASPRSGRGWPRNSGGMTGAMTTATTRASCGAGPRRRNSGASTWSVTATRRTACGGRWPPKASRLRSLTRLIAPHPECRKSLPRTSPVNRGAEP